jgi:hypothetical protein
LARTTPSNVNASHNASHEQGGVADYLRSSATT